MPNLAAFVSFAVLVLACSMSPQRNEQMYLSWWQRMNGASPGYPQDDMGNGGEDEPRRFGARAVAVAPSSTSPSRA